MTNALIVLTDYQDWRNTIKQRRVTNLRVGQIWQQAVAIFGQQPVEQIPWGDNLLVFTKRGSVAEADFWLGHDPQPQRISLFRD